MKDYIKTIISALQHWVTSVAVMKDEREQLSTLIEADMLPAVRTSNGAILTDEKGNIVLRY